MQRVHIREKQKRFAQNFFFIDGTIYISSNLTVESVGDDAKILSSIFLWQSKRREKNEHETFLPWQRNFRGISLNVECMWISALIDSMKEYLVRKLISHRLGSVTFLLVFPLLWEIFQNIISNKKSTLLEIIWEKVEWSSACLGRYVYCTYCTMQIYF